MWARAGAGFRAVIAPSLGDIFRENCLENGMLPVLLPSATVAELRDRLHARPGATVTVDLPAQTVEAPDGAVHRFEVDAFPREKLLGGLDDIALTEGYAAAIAAFGERRKTALPWMAR